MFKDEFTLEAKEYIKKWINENRQNLNAGNIKAAVKSLATLEQRDLVVSYLLLSGTDVGIEFITPVEDLLGFIRGFKNEKKYTSAVSCKAVATIYDLADAPANLQDYGKVAQMLGFSNYELDTTDIDLYDHIIASGPLAMQRWVNEANSQGDEFEMSEFILHPAWR